MDPEDTREPEQEHHDGHGWDLVPRVNLSPCGSSPRYLSDMDQEPEQAQPDEEQQTAQPGPRAANPDPAEATAASETASEAGTQTDTLSEEQHGLASESESDFGEASGSSQAPSSHPNFPAGSQLLSGQSSYADISADASAPSSETGSDGDSDTGALPRSTPAAAAAGSPSERTEVASDGTLTPEPALGTRSPSVASDLRSEPGEDFPLIQLRAPAPAAESDAAPEPAPLAEEAAAEPIPEATLAAETAAPVIVPEAAASAAAQPQALAEATAVPEGEQLPANAPAADVAANAEEATAGWVAWLKGAGCQRARELLQRLWAQVTLRAGSLLPAKVRAGMQRLLDQLRGLCPKAPPPPALLLALCAALALTTALSACLAIKNCRLNQLLRERDGLLQDLVVKALRLDSKLMNRSLVDIPIPISHCAIKSGVSLSRSMF